MREGSKHGTRLRIKLILRGSEMRLEIRNWSESTGVLD